MQPLRIGIAVALALLASPSPDSPDADAASRGIRSLLERQVADWNRKDLDAFCEGYWKSPRLVFQSGGTKHVGWDAMRDRYRKAYQGDGREMGMLRFADIEIEPLSPSSAFARGRWELALSGGKSAGGLFTLVLRKLPEGWRIVHDHTSSDAR